MSNKRIKVAGYSQKVTYTDNIEYRNFSPDLVGLQLTSDGGTPLFTMGNFAVTTNLDPKKNKNFVTSKFSNFVTLTDLNLTVQQTLDLLTNNAGVILNLDRTNLNNYALFGSLTEAIRVALENIITTWPAALYITPEYALEPLYVTQSGYTLENYTYDSISDVATFSVNTTVIINNFQLNYKDDGNLSNTFNQENDLRDLVLNYEAYSILFNGTEYEVLNFTGSSTTNDYLHFAVKGNLFSGQTNGYETYYVKPNKKNENLFYNSLPSLEYYLLDRLVEPKFTATFKYSIKSDSGDILYVNDSLTWPTTDGYNLDFDTDQYAEYATKLLEISTNYDLTISNLMVRFLVTESITDFDTTGVHLTTLDQDSSGQKVNKTLNIYGVEFDKINAFIGGIQFANTVSYDKLNNTPDIYLKNIAKVMGWDLVSSVLENNLLTSYIEPKESTFSGQSVGLTAVEADVELWRRIILNTPWLWKSKGTRKGIEFMFKFIGTPLGLITFNEYVYLANNRVDVDVFQAALRLNGLDDDLSAYPISLSGYPQPLPNTPDLYFQSKGLWYRETGGENSTLDITTGNNPHAGPYDGGYQYINQFNELIPNFTAVTISSETQTIETSNLFTNYKLGTMTNYTGNTYVDITTEGGVDFSNCYVVTSEIIQDPKLRQDETDCGCTKDENLKSLSICIEKADVLVPTCADKIASVNLFEEVGYYVFDFKQYNMDGSLYEVNGTPVNHTSKFIEKGCCNFNDSVPYFYNELDNGVIQNSGYICCKASNNRCGSMVTCKWKISPLKTIDTSGDTKYVVFVNENNITRVTSQDGYNCVNGYTVPVQITDPYTNELGYGCQLTQLGIQDIQSSDSVLVKTYTDRANGVIGCSEIADPLCNLSLTMTHVNTVGNQPLGSASVITSGGTLPYTYLWNNGLTTSSITGLTSGTYYVSVTDANACITTGSTTITNSEIVVVPPAYSITLNNQCIGPSANFTIDGFKAGDVVVVRGNIFAILKGSNIATYPTRADLRLIDSEDTNNLVYKSSASYSDILSHNVSVDADLTVVMSGPSRIIATHAIVNNTEEGIRTMSLKVVSVNGVAVTLSQSGCIGTSTGTIY